MATPFPQSDLAKVIEDRGYLKKDYTQIEVEDDIENQVFFETPYLSSEKLLAYKKIFLAEFYKKKIWEKPFYYFKRAIKNPGLIRKVWQKF